MEEFHRRWKPESFTPYTDKQGGFQRLFFEAQGENKFLPTNPNLKDVLSGTEETRLSLFIRSYSLSLLSEAGDGFYYPEEAQIFFSRLQRMNPAERNAFFDELGVYQRSNFFKGLSDLGFLALITSSGVKLLSEYTNVALVDSLAHSSTAKVVGLVSLILAFMPTKKPDNWLSRRKRKSEKAFIGTADWTTVGNAVADILENERNATFDLFELQQMVAYGRIMGCKQALQFLSFHGLPPRRD